MIQWSLREMGHAGKVFPLENGFGVLLYGALCVCAYLCVLGYIGVHAYGDVCTCVPTRVCMSLRCPLVTVRPQGSGPPEWEGSGVSCPSVPLPFLCLGFRVTRCSQGHVRWSCVRGSQPHPNMRLLLLLPSPRLPNTSPRPSETSTSPTSVYQVRGSPCP